MAVSPVDKLEHLAWAVEARAQNQRSALRLLSLFSEHRTKWTSKRWARAAQSLLSVTFSLWRAAFLAEKTGKRTKVFDEGVKFLERLIADNAISYPQDRNSNEWTFNYYTKNAKAALQELAGAWPNLVAPYEDKTRPAIERWNYCQQQLDNAIAAFGVAVAAPSRTAAQSERTAAKKAKKQRRKISRDFARAAKIKEAKGSADHGMS